ncbi:MAG: hypothetical protein FWC50_08550, partial [Planctomycetaceae bacterium]|nr:hypothetical protein [Planctomycetaceae bacterium]
IPQPVWAAAFGLAQTSCVAGLAVSSFRNFQPAWVYLVDGAEVTGADTPENQAVYPQPDTQLPGCGFPMMRIVVLTSLITAMVRSVAVGPYSGKETGENALFRKVAEDIPRGSGVHRVAIFADRDIGPVPAAIIPTDGFFDI